MNTEILIVIITVVSNIIITGISILANIYITKLSNIDKLHEYKKHMSPFEVEHRPNNWIKDIVSDDEFLKYDEETKELIKIRYTKIVDNDVKKETEGSTDW